MPDMTRSFLIQEVDAFADRLVAIGDIESFENAFGTEDIEFDITLLSDEELQEIYDEFIEGD